MFTKAIRKIFNANQLSAGMMVDKAAKKAYSVGYNLMNFNGQIFSIVKIDGKVKAFKTGLNINDLKVE